MSGSHSAFPWTETDQVTGTPFKQHPGMDLRDYFAAKVLQGELASQGEGFVWNDYDKLADHCYYMAEKMLHARRSSKQVNDNLRRLVLSIENLTDVAKTSGAIVTNYIDRAFSDSVVLFEHPEDLRKFAQMILDM